MWGGFKLNANKEVMYWKENKEWYLYNELNEKYELTKKATERAILSFEMYKKRNNY